MRVDPQVKKIPWRGARQPTQVFLPGECYGQRSLAGYSPWGCKELDTTEATQQYTHTVNGHLGLQVYKYLSESLFSILLGVCPEMELLDHLIILHLIFYEELISTATAHFIFPSAGCEVLGFISFFNMYLFSYIGSSLQYLGSFIVMSKLLSSCSTRDQQLRRCGLVAPWHVGSEFPNQGSNLRPLPWKADS